MASACEKKGKAGEQEQNGVKRGNERKSELIRSTANVSTLELERIK